MSKIIFLDMDGVLNSSRSSIAYDGYGRAKSITDPKLDPVAVKMLQRLVQDSDAKIVISSSWRRLIELHEFITVFEQYNWCTNNIIIGKTPSLNGCRGLEIKTWLDGNENYRYAKFVILDDSSDMLDEQKHNFIHVNPDVGFGFEDYKSAYYILTGKEL